MANPSKLSSVVNAFTTDTNGNAGTVKPENLATVGTPGNTTFLRGDGQWATPAGGGGGTPAGATGEFQWNNAGSFGGSPGLTYNSTTNTAQATNPPVNQTDLARLSDVQAASAGLSPVTPLGTILHIAEGNVLGTYVNGSGVGNSTFSGTNRLSVAGVIPAVNDWVLLADQGPSTIGSIQNGSYSVKTNTAGSNAVLSMTIVNPNSTANSAGQQIRLTFSNLTGAPATFTTPVANIGETFSAVLARTPSPTGWTLAWNSGTAILTLTCTTAGAQWLASLPPTVSESQIGPDWTGGTPFPQNLVPTQAVDASFVLQRTNTIPRFGNFYVANNPVATNYGVQYQNTTAGTITVGTTLIVFAIFGIQNPKAFYGPSFSNTYESTIVTGPGNNVNFTDTFNVYLPSPTPISNQMVTVTSAVPTLGVILLSSPLSNVADGTPIAVFAGDNTWNGFGLYQLNIQSIVGVRFSGQYSLTTYASSNIYLTAFDTKVRVIKVASKYIGPLGPQYVNGQTYAQLRQGGTPNPADFPVGSCFTYGNYARDIFLTVAATPTVSGDGTYLIIPIVERDQPFYSSGTRISYVIGGPSIKTASIAAPLQSDATGNISLPFDSSLATDAAIPMSSYSFGLAANPDWRTTYLGFDGTTYSLRRVLGASALSTALTATITNNTVNAGSLTLSGAVTGAANNDTLIFFANKNQGPSFIAVGVYNSTTFVLANVQFNNAPKINYDGTTTAIVYSGSIWASAAVTSGSGSVPNLQQVTDSNNVTTNSIVLGANNILTLAGGISGTTPSIRATGSSQFIGINIVPKAGSNVNIGDMDSTYLQVSNTGGQLNLWAAGTNNNAKVSIEGTGTGAIQLAGQNANFVSVTGGALNSSVAISADGSDNNIGIAINPRGTGSVNVCSQQTNYLSVTGSATGVAPELASAGSDDNVDINLTTKGNGVIRIRNTLNNSFTVNAANGNVGYNLIDLSTGELRIRSSASAGITIGNLNPNGTVPAAQAAINLRTTATQAIVQAFGADTSLDLVLRAQGAGVVSLGADGQGVYLGPKTPGAYSTPIFAANAANNPSNMSAGSAGDAFTSRGSGNTPFWSTPYNTGIINLAAFTPPSIGDQLVNLGTLPNTLPSDWSYSNGQFTNNSGRSRSVTVQGKVQGATGAAAPGECNLWVAYGLTSQAIGQRNRPWQWTLTYAIANITMNPNSGGAWAAASGSPWINFSVTFDVPSGQVFGIYMFGQNAAWTVGGTPAGTFGSASIVTITIRP